jgi:hypothetical protein
VEYRRAVDAATVHPEVAGVAVGDFRQFVTDGSQRKFVTNFGERRFKCSPGLESALPTGSDAGATNPGRAQ